VLAMLPDVAPNAGGRVPDRGVRPRLLDLFCGAGGAAMGYFRAGFDVTGVDIKPQPRYPFSFVQGDALEYVKAHGHEYDVIHASPPCQPFSSMRHVNGGTSVEDLLRPTQSLLRTWVKPFVIENVEGAPIIVSQPELFSPLNGIIICGSGLGLRIEGRGYLRRHRLFESNVPLANVPCRHRGRALGVYGGGGIVNERHNTGSAEERRIIMGMPWANRDECAQAIPPAYTEFIGRQLLAAL
jgi:DNA (cytosine-5)-methyltransferase 1